MENDGVHLESHKGIHHGALLPPMYLFVSPSTRVSSILTGLEDLTNLVNKYKKDPTSYNPVEFRACLDSWRQVLFTHLDDEVIWR